MYNTVPSFIKYQMEYDAIAEMKTHYNNKFYGGSLLKNVKSESGVEIPNNFNDSFDGISREQKHLDRYLIY